MTMGDVLSLSPSLPVVCSIVSDAGQTQTDSRLLRRPRPNQSHPNHGTTESVLASKRPVVFQDFSWCVVSFCTPKHDTRLLNWNRRSEGGSNQLVRIGNFFLPRRFPDTARSLFVQLVATCVLKQQNANMRVNKKRVVRTGAFFEGGSMKHPDRVG